MSYVSNIPDGLTKLAAAFLRIHAVRMERLRVEQYRTRWLKLGVPDGVIDRAADFEARWGGLVLPPAPWYEGGPCAFRVDIPYESPEGTWLFSAGDQRCSVPFGFMIGPEGEFGITCGRWTPLHATVHGWVESVALAHHASRWAGQITRLSGVAVQDLDLSGLEPVRQVAGLADTWWKGPDSLLAVYRGEADCFAGSRFLRADRYDGLPEHAFKFDATGPGDRQ